MRFDSSQYRLWKKYQNAKNLVKRTEKKARQTRTRSKLHEVNLLAKSNPYFDEKLNRYHFVAPSNFSIVTNSNDTLAVFDSLLDYIRTNRNKHKAIFIDVSNVTELSIDSIMYLLCIVNNLKKNEKYKYNFHGNYPINAEARRRFNESGFNNFVNSRISNGLSRKTDKIQISAGNNIDTRLAREIVNFLREKSTNSDNFAYVYEILIELMGNTWKHAYTNNTSELFDACWYSYVELEDNKAKISFLDTGIGIPKSIYKKVLEKANILNPKTDSEYIASALRGEGRTETRQSNRGKGLPSFVEIVNDGFIQKFRIISLKGDVSAKKDDIISNELNKKFFGTLYYWEVNI